MKHLPFFVPFLFLAASCATTTPTPAPPPPAPAPIVAEPIERELVPGDARYSQWLDVAFGQASESASIGGETGVRSAWFRFEARRPGKAEVTLSSSSDQLLSVALYDDSVVLHPGAAIPEIGYRLAIATPQSIDGNLAKGVYYVEVACGPQAPRTDFEVSVTFAPDPLPQQVVAQGTRSRVPRPAPPPRPVHTPAPTTTPRPSTPAFTPVPVPEPPPPPLLTPRRSEAIALSSGSSAMTEIGGKSGYRWRWYEVTLVKRGKLLLDVFASGAPVEVQISDAHGKPVETLEVAHTGTHSGIHPAGKMYIRVGPAAKDAAAYVTVMLKVAVAGVIKQGQ